MESIQCNEYTYPVLVVVKPDYKIYKAIRARLTTEENFKWRSAKAVCKAPRFKPEKVVAWTFLLDKEYFEQLNLVENEL